MYNKIIFCLLSVFMGGTLMGNHAEKSILGIRDSLEKVYRYSPGEEKFEAALKIIDILKETNLDTAFIYAEEALAEAQRTNKEYYISAFTMSRGELERLKGNYEEAFKHLEHNIAYAHKRGYEYIYANSLLIKAKAHLDLSMMDAAYRDIVASASAFENLKDEKGLREVATVHGCIYLNEKKADEAVSYFVKARGIDLKHGYTEWLMADAINLGIAYSYMNNTDSTWFYYNKALEAVDTNLYPRMSITVYMNIALAYGEVGQYEKALEMLEKAIGQAYLNQNNQLNTQVLTSAGYIYTLSGHEQKGIDCFERSFNLAKTYDFVDIAYLNTQSLSSYYWDKGMFKEAANWLKLQNMYADSSAVRQNLNNLMNLRYQYQYERREQELAYEQRMKVVAWVSVILILLLVIVLLLIVFSRYRLKLKNANLVQVNMSNELEHKKKEIFTKVMYLRKKNEAIQEIAERLMAKKPLFKPDNQIIIGNIVKDLLDYCKDDSWKEFELRFEEIYVDFFKNLSDKYPDLTANEKRLCAYLKLNMTTKDIASLLHMSVAGVESARYRLRKKLKINNMEVDLNAFLESL